MIDFTLELFHVEELLFGSQGFTVLIWGGSKKKTNWTDRFVKVVVKASSVYWKINVMERENN